MITAILACHDRRALTEQALTALVASAAHADATLRVVLFDDGSSDGTAEAAAAVLPVGTLTVLQGDGNAFWAKGMSTAEQRALADSGPADHVLWLNDDVLMDEDALAMMLETLEGRTDRFVVGATTDPATGLVNYGGYVPDGVHPLRFRHVVLDGRPHPITTLNGNCVLVPVPAARRVGGIDGTFSHGLADIDYGLRANAAGVQPVLAPRPIGSCPSHDSVRARPVAEEWARFRSVKGGGHRRSMTRILRRAAPRTWPVFMAWSYGAWWARALPREALRRLGRA